MSRKIKRNYLNIIEDNGTLCISLSTNIRRYYADNMKHRKLKFKRYEVY